METAMRLRRAGLEPGRIARLTVLVGDVTGVIPSDGDLGEGDQVAAFEPRSLLLGIARASRYTGVDNPRLWTTADVRAALEALGLEGRGPTVEELNGEGFPYSPYVLRKPELLTPAAMAAAPPAAGPVAPAPEPVVQPAAPGPVPPAREQPSPAAIAQAVAASAAAGHAAAAVEAEQARSPQAAPPQNPQSPQSPQNPRDTVAIDGPPGTEDTGGIGGLFAGAEPAPPSGTVVPPRTSVFPVTAAPAAAPAPAPQRFSYWTDQSAPVDDDGEDDAPESAGRRTALWIAAGLVLVVALAVGGWLALRGRGDGGASANAPSADQPAASGPKVGDVQEVGGVTYTVAAVKVDDTCEGHAYGDTASFFADTDCTGLSRALYSAEIDGHPVVLAVSHVQMTDADAARKLQELTDRNGSGNVSDLLREGVRYTGSPAELSGAEYASALSGPVVTIVESAWVEEGAGDSAAIDQAADDGLALQVPPFPAS
jgi:hypothetical protein